MITLYSTFRRFNQPRFAKIQKDAIKSWQKIKEIDQIVILGNDQGTAEICKEYGLHHIPNVKRSKVGTPYLNDIINTAENVAKNDIMLLLSGDIIIKQDTVKAANFIKEQLKDFCVCARKEHVDIDDQGNKTSVRWATWQAGDYWLHSKGIFAEMPDFLIGRHKLEKWMYRMLCNKNALVDGTDIITVWHQHHPHDFKPSNNELEYNENLYNEHYFEVEKWKDTQWYDRKCINIGINFSNWNITSDMQLVENETPRREPPKS